MIDVILCDDHALIRRGIRNTLCDATDIRVIGEAGDYGELRTLMRTLAGERAARAREPAITPSTTANAACDVLVLDINLPGRGGLDVLGALKDEGSPVRVLVVSMYPEDQYALRALRAGAFGYVNKGGDPQTIVQAVRTVAAGRKFVTPEIAQMLVESLNAPAPENRHQSLSDRELQTLIRLASGKRPAEIALELALSAKTVYVYRDRVKEKLGLSNESEMTMYALRNGLIAQ
jgi:two-component system, NarL family, invasion response regulator UvrY